MPITEIVVETVRFDTQLLVNPEISDVGYQQGTLYGYECREYLQKGLAKAKRFSRGISERVQSSLRARGMPTGGKTR